MTGQAVRVTIEGDLHRVSETRSVLVYDGGQCHLVSDSPALVIEDMEPARRWTNGDAVQNAAGDEHDGNVFVRRGEDRWLYGHAVSYTSDDVVSALVDEGRLRVLRYQHGGDQ